MPTRQPQVSFPVDGCVKVLWEQIATGDTLTPFTLPGNKGAIGSIQMTGTFGGASVSLQASNDGANWVTLDDTNGDQILKTAATLQDFSTGALYIRPYIIGGTSDDVDVTVVLRG